MHNRNGAPPHALGYPNISSNGTGNGTANSPAKMTNFYGGTRTGPNLLSIVGAVSLILLGVALVSIIGTSSA